MSSSEREQLKPCPFCGAESHFEKDGQGWQWVECGSCGMQGNRRASLMEDCRPLLAEEWNRRAQASAEPCAWLFQHDETGRMTCVANDGMNTPEVFMRLNPRQLYVGPAYAAPQQAPSDYVLQLLVAAGHVTQSKVDEARAIATDLGITAAKAAIAAGTNGEAP